MLWADELTSFLACKTGKTSYAVNHANLARHRSLGFA